MGTAELRNLITKSINSADIGLLQYIAVAIDNYEAKELFSSSILTEDQIKELDKRRERYLSDEGKSYSWEEVKQNRFRTTCCTPQTPPLWLWNCTFWFPGLSRNRCGVTLPKRVLFFRRFQNLPFKTDQSQNPTPQYYSRSIGRLRVLGKRGVDATGQSLALTKRGAKTQWSFPVGSSAATATYYRFPATAGTQKNTSQHGRLQWQSQQ